MKYVLFVICLFGSICSFGQEKSGKDWVYRFGAGPGIEGNWGFWALNIIQEVSFYPNDRFSINPSISYFFSVRDTDGPSFPPPPTQQANADQEHLSSIFSDLRFQYDVVRSKKGTRVGLGFGPSFQYGGETMHGGYGLNERGEYEGIWRIEKFSRLGYVTQITVDWKGKGKTENRIGVSMSSFAGYWPYYLMVNYRIGLHL